MAGALPTTLATVVSRDFLPGARVMLDSFLATNTWFEGRIVVIHDELSEEEERGLAQHFPQLYFTRPEQALLAAITTLVAAQPKLANRSARFFSLQSFWLENDGPILFCDSDLLFLGDLSGDLAMPGDMLACADRAQLVGNTRDPETMTEIAQKDPSNSSHEAAHCSFNAGLMLLREPVLDRQSQVAVLDQLTPQAWASVASDHTDQAVLNRLFGRQVKLLDPALNYLVGHSAQYRATTQLQLDQVKGLHFNGPAKPWRPETHHAAVARDASFIKACQYWFDAHSRYLTRRHLAARRDS